jgi:DNA modification methylase
MIHEVLADGIEIDPDYYQIAKRRIREALMQPRLI